MRPRTVFMGTPEFAVPTLKALSKEYDIVGVYTQPDRPAGRGKQVSPSPVKVAAQGLHLRIFQPPRIKRDALETLTSLAPDLIVVAAFGQILRKTVLGIPQFGCINVHASLLPRWRGASPINAAIFHGDSVTGISIMLMDEGIDTGPVLAQTKCPILLKDTAVSLSEKLAQLSAELLVHTLPDYLNGERSPQPQPESGATYAGILKKVDARLDLTLPAHQLERHVRAYIPWPGSQIEWLGQPLKILRASVAPGSAAPGSRHVIRNSPAVAAADGMLILEQVQPAGKRPMDGSSFLAGARNWING